MTTLNFAHANNDFSAVTTWENFGFNSGITSLQFHTNADFSATTNMALFLSGTAISTADYDALLIALSLTATNVGVVLHAGSSTHSVPTGAAAKAILIANRDPGDLAWTITDGGPA